MDWLFFPYPESSSSSESEEEESVDAPAGGYVQMSEEDELKELARRESNMQKMSFASEPYSDDTKKDLVGKRTAAKGQFTLREKFFNERVQATHPDEPDKISAAFTLFDEAYEKVLKINDLLVVDYAIFDKSGKENPHAKWGEEIEARRLTAYETRNDFYQAAEKRAQERGEKATTSASAGASGGDFAKSLADALNKSNPMPVFEKKMGTIFGQQYAVSDHIKQPFDGTASGYTTFIQKWKNCAKVLEEIGKSDADKFLDLLEVLSGEAKKLVKDLPAMDSSYQLALDHLESVYGDVMTMVCQAVNQILEVKQADNASGLRKTYTTLWSSMATLDALKLSAEEMAFVLFCAMAERTLPQHVKQKWHNTRTKMQDKGTKAGRADFFKCMRDQMKKDLALGEQKPKQASGGKQPDHKTASSLNAGKAQKGSGKCLFCDSSKSTHPAWKCNKVKTMDRNSIVKIIRNNKLCWNCLEPFRSHERGECPAPQCSMPSCGQFHHKMIHRSDKEIAEAKSKQKQWDASKKRGNGGNGKSQGGDKGGESGGASSASENKDGAAGASSASAVESEESMSMNMKKKKPSRTVLTRTLQAYAVAPDGSSYKARVFLDSGAELNLVTRQMAAVMGVKGKRTSLSLAVAGGGITKATEEQSIQFCLRSLDGRYTTPQMEACTIAKISKEIVEVSVDPREEYAHLRNIPFTEEFPRPSTDVDILVGEPFYTFLENGKSVKGNISEPYAISTKLGWVLGGSLPGEGGNGSRAYTVMQTTARDPLQEQLEKFWDTEILGLNEKDTAVTVDDQHAVDLMAKVTRYDPEKKQYSTELLWKPGCREQLQDNNYYKAKALMQSVEKRCTKNNQLDQVNGEFNKFVENGFSELVGEDVPPCVQEKGQPSQEYYMETHAVWKDSETTSCRLVSNASSKSAKNGNKSLNDLVYQGPSLQADLVSLLLRFRDSAVAIVADLSKMFLRIKLHNENDKDCLRYIWRFGDANGAIKTFRMVAVTFGVISSPFQAIWVVMNHAERFKERFPLAYEVVRTSLYVDDVCYCVKSVAEARAVIAELIALFELASMKIQKWQSNEEEALSGIPKDEQFSRNKEVMKVLGVSWDSGQDLIFFDFIEKVDEVEGGKETKRTVVAQVAKCYDVLGLVQPFVIIAKAIFQKLCLAQLGWDEVLPVELAEEYGKWKEQIPQLVKCKIARHAFPKDEDPTEIFLAVFGDASQTAYGAVVYLVKKYPSGKTCASLCMSKGKVTPTQMTLRLMTVTEEHQLTIVRLELMAAVLAARLGSYVANALNVGKVYYFTDSLITLSRIRRPARSWRQWVGNRLVDILKHSKSADNWFYVPTQLNPADLISRGAELPDLLENSLWFQGPEFLQTPPETWRRFEIATNHMGSREMDVDMEERVVTVVQEPKIEPNAVLQSLALRERFRTVVKVLAYVQKWINAVRERARLRLTSAELRRRARNDDRVVKSVRRNTFDYTVLSVEKAEFDTAVTKLWELVQKDDPIMGAEIRFLKENDLLKKNSVLRDYNPFMEDGLLKSKTRLRMSQIRAETATPILLPKHNVFVEKYVMFLHISLLHCGTEQTMHMVQERCRILGGKTEIRRIIRKCADKRCQPPPLFSPPVAPLPSLRIDDPEPFVRVSVDFFGPLYVKHECKIDGCLHASESKAYGCVFSCFSTRAVHIELVQDLTTQSFLDAMSKLIARRGCPSYVLSDNAKTFKAAEKELRNLYKNLDFDKIKATAGKPNDIQWVFNTEKAPWANSGVERFVGLIKKPLKIALADSKLTFARLEILLMEIEALLNNRPLSTVSEGGDFSPVRPAELCIGRPLTAFPDGRSRGDRVIEGSDFVKKLRRRRQLLSHFWTLWRRDYLMALAPERVWQTQAGKKRLRAIVVGDIVLLHDDGSRGTWKLARVAKLNQGQDGHVRTVELTLPNGKTLTRPVRKLALLEGAVEL